MSLFIMIFGGAILLSALVTGDIAIWSGNVKRSQNPALFWTAFSFYGGIVFGCMYLYFTVPGF